MHDCKTQTSIVLRMSSTLNKLPGHLVGTYFKEIHKIKY